MLSKTAKLSAREVRQIRSLKDQRSRAEVARLYNVYPATIRDIWSGKNWAWLSDELTIRPLKLVHSGQVLRT